MRQARPQAPEHHGVACYHGISRVVNREFVVGREDRGQFEGMMRCDERFNGVSGRTCCVRSSHYHLLLSVPSRPAHSPGYAGLLARAKAIADAEK